jgi:hypothetical protein
VQCSSGQGCFVPGGATFAEAKGDDIARYFRGAIGDNCPISDAPVDDPRINRHIE